MDVINILHLVKQTIVADYDHHFDTRLRCARTDIAVKLHQENVSAKTLMSKQANILQRRIYVNTAKYRKLGKSRKYQKIKLQMLSKQRFRICIT